MRQMSDGSWEDGWLVCSRCCEWVADDRAAFVAIRAELRGEGEVVITDTVCQRCLAEYEADPALDWQVIRETYLAAVLR